MVRPFDKPMKLQFPVGITSFSVPVRSYREQIFVNTWKECKLYDTMYQKFGLLTSPIGKS